MAKEEPEQLEEERKQFISRFIQKAVARKTYKELNNEVKKIKEEELANEAGIRVLLIALLVFLISIILIYLFLK